MVSEVSFQVYYSPKRDQLFTCSGNSIVDILAWDFCIGAQLKDAWFDTRKAKGTMFVKNRAIPKTYIYIGEL